MPTWLYQTRGITAYSCAPPTVKSTTSSGVVCLAWKTATSRQLSLTRRKASRGAAPIHCMSQTVKTTAYARCAFCCASSRSLQSIGVEFCFSDFFEGFSEVSFSEGLSFPKFSEVSFHISRNSKVWARSSSFHVNKNCEIPAGKQFFCLMHSTAFGFLLHKSYQKLPVTWGEIGFVWMRLHSQFVWGVKFATQCFH